MNWIRRNKVEIAIVGTVVILGTLMLLWKLGLLG